MDDWGVCNLCIGCCHKGDEIASIRSCRERQACTGESSRQQRWRIRSLFTRIARRYDRVNRVISLGQDQRWRREAVALLDVPPHGAVLDVATGTGDVALIAREYYPAARILGVDLTSAMVHQAARKAKLETAQLHWALSDGLSLACADNAFDAVISAFMIRNVPDIAQAFAEQRRVVSPGGRMVCLEMTWPSRFPMSWLFPLYFFGWAALVGRILSGDHEAYQYLPRSVRQFLSPEAIVATMQSVGWREVAHTTRMGGTVAIYTGIK
ncbi:MAG: ubiquinone/menaquinone biosynthesis methyltransferase [Anaerolineales bacterium]